MTIYAYLWTLSGTKDEFESTVPDLLAWLGGLERAGKLRGCGAWLEGGGGLTLVEAADEAEAREIDAGNPLNRIGTTRIVAWDVYYANLHVDATFTPG